MRIDRVLLIRGRYTLTVYYEITDVAIALPDETQNQKICSSFVKIEN